MKYNTCEEYVLAELTAWQDRATQFQEEGKKIAEEANERIDNYKKAIEYGNKVIGLLAQLNELSYKEVKDEEGNTVKVLCISPKQGVVKLDLAVENDQYIYNLLAPIIGDEEVKKEVEAKAKEADGENLSSETAKEE